MAALTVMVNKGVDTSAKNSLESHFLRGKGERQEFIKFIRMSLGVQILPFIEIGLARLLVDGVQNL